MARRFTNKPNYVVAGDLSANFTGPWLDVREHENLLFHVAWTGTPTGTLRVDGSNDGPSAEDPNTRLVGPSGRVAPSPLVTVASGNPAGAAGNLMIPVTNTGARWARLAYARTGGAGAIDCGFAGKGT